MFKIIKQKTAQMFLWAGPAFVAFLIGAVIGAVVIFLWAKGIIPGGSFICPK